MIFSSISERRFSVLRTRAVIKFVSRTASTLQNTGVEQGALREFSLAGIHFVSILFVLCQVIENKTTSLIVVEPIPAAYGQL